MKVSPRRARRAQTATPRVGVFGKVGAGNIGNDASMEAILGYLRAEHPGATVDAMCTGPDVVRSRYGIDAVFLFWHQKFRRQASGVTTASLKVLGKGVDVIRTASWVRSHDVVIVPGAGVLEASLPMIPRGFPYSLFLLCASGRMFGTKVAMVSVGAGAVNQPLTRWLFNSAARLAFYRSYRDAGARAAMLKRGLDTSGDNVYPDLAFALPAPPCDAGDEQTVAVGVMAYYGTNDERKQAEVIYSRYVDGMKLFVRWLVDSGRKVILIVGDTNGSDDAVVQQILTDLRAYRPDLDPSVVVAAAVSSYADVMRVLQPAGSVVAIRYHNILCALKLSKPTISIGYSPKHDVLMTEMGLSEFCQSVSTLDISELTKLFTELEHRSGQLRQEIMERNAAKARLIDDLFEELSATLFPPAEPAYARSGTSPAQ
ncbi:MAG: polysaccharide pyruvyl transferase family protein [Streptosporangiaceae bacterium]